MRSIREFQTAIERLDSGGGGATHEKNVGGGLYITALPAEANPADPLTVLQSETQAHLAG